MTTEELKMIIEVLGRVSDTAGSAVQWWMVLHYGEKVFNTACVMLGIGGTIGYIAYCIKSSFLRELESLEARRK